MNEPHVEITHRPRSPQYTDVPECIRQWAKAHDLRLSWQANDVNILSLKFGQSMRPVRASDLEENAPEVWQELQEMHRLMVNDEGYFQRFDAVLCTQPEAAWREYDEMQDRDRAEREHGASAMDQLEDEMQDLMGSTGRHSGAPVLTGTVPTARETVKKAPAKAKGVTVGVNKE